MHMRESEDAVDAAGDSQVRLELEGDAKAENDRRKCDDGFDQGQRRAGNAKGASRDDRENHYAGLPKAPHSPTATIATK